MKFHYSCDVGAVSDAHYSLDDGDICELHVCDVHDVVDDGDARDVNGIIVGDVLELGVDNYYHFASFFVKKPSMIF
jgi:hypothetical protein